MKPLNRLLLADARRMWRQGLAISILLACGIATFVMSTSTMRSLAKSQANYYATYSFGHVFVTLTRAPNELARRLAEIPGVARATSRIVREVILDVPNMIEPATCRLVSMSNNSSNDLNGVFLVRGRFPNPMGHPEAIASQPFADAHQLRPGDWLDVIMGGRKERIRIVGISMSPEFVYAVQPGLLLTDNRRFGVLWMPRRQLEAAFNMEGAFNDVVLQLRSHAVTQEVIHQADRLTKPYGGIGAYDRSDQPSHHRVADEMQQMNAMAYVTPAIFLAVSTFLFNIALSRMVHQQTEQIATLRAFGFTRWEIGGQYIKLVLVLVALGAVIGCLAGARMSWWMTDAYVHFFRFPVVHRVFAAGEAALAVLAALLAAALGSYSAIRRAMALPPAVAMRPEVPRISRRSLTHVSWISPLLSPTMRMIVRRLETNRRTTIYSILGMSLATGVLVLGSFMEDTIDYVIDLQFYRSQRQDVMLTFYETLSADALQDVSHLPGVAHVEPFRAVPVRLRFGVREHRLSLMGLEEDPQLYRVLDQSERPISLPSVAGLTISKKLAELLQVRVGDVLTVEVLEGKQVQQDVSVRAIFPDYASPGAYLNRRELHSLLNEGERLSGVFLAVQPGRVEDLYAAVKRTPTVAGVLDKNAASKNFEDTIAENTLVMRTVNAVFASIIAFGVIYNCALITLAERSRDLATMRVMGFTRYEVSLVLLGELAVITVMSIPIGLPIGYGFSYLTTVAIDTETHRFPLVVSRATYAYSAVGILAASMVSSLFVRRMLDQLDLISVLKVKE